MDEGRKNEDRNRKININRIYSYMQDTNTPSQRVAEKNGMKLIMEYEAEDHKTTKVYAITIDAYLNKK